MQPAPHSPSSKSRRPAVPVVAAAALFSVVIPLALLSLRSFPVFPSVLHPDAPPDLEALLSRSVLPPDDDIPVHNLSDHMLACMPTVHRRGVEYVSNAVKSWRVATKSAPALHRLVVFDMRDPRSTRPPFWHPHARWQHRVLSAPFPSSLRRDPPSPSWLSVLRRDAPLRMPRKLTLGDSAARVAWRAKEAQDYAHVLERCAALATGEFFLVVQDDVLFTRGISASREWAAVHLREVPPHSGGGVRRACSGSLFDLAQATSTGTRPLDGHALQASNLVARVWRKSDVPRVARYLAENFDEAPVDWLVDRLCKRRRWLTPVMEPNPVRHRGSVSSFAENKRQGTLT